jgi:outer membrane protein assembly factor BamB
MQRDAHLSGTAFSELSYEHVPAAEAAATGLRSVRVGGGRERFTSPLVAEHGLLAMCSASGRLFLLNRFTGEVLSVLGIEEPQGEAEYAALFRDDWIFTAGGRTVAGAGLLDPFNTWESGRFQLPGWSWKKTLPGSVRWPANAVQNNGSCRILVVTQNGGTQLHCLDGATGDSVWKRPATPPEIGVPVFGEPSRAYVLTAEGEVLQIELETGKMIASPRRIEDPDLRIPPVWQDDTLYFFNTDGQLCISMTGPQGPGAPAPTTEYKLNSVVGMAVSPQAVLVSYARGLALLSRTGQKLWTGGTDMEDACGTAPMIAGTVGFGVGVNRSFLYACDLKGGGFRYRRLGVGQQAIYSAAAYAEGFIYTCSHQGEVNWLRVDVS